MNSDSVHPKSRLTHQSAEVRRRAALDIVGLDSPEALNLLIQALGDEEWRVRKEAVSVASQMQKDGHPKLISRLIDEMVQEDQIGLRNASCEALTSIGQDAINEIIDRMSSFHEGGRKIAIEVLGASKDPRAVDELILRLDDPDWNVRACAAEWLGERTNQKATTALIKCLKSGDRLVILCALQSLNRTGVAVPWDVLKPLSTQKLFGSELLLALGRCGEAQAAAILFGEIAQEPSAARALELLHGSSDEAAKAVEKILADIDDQAMSFLIDCTSQGEPQEQRSAAGCILWTRRLDQIETIVSLSSQESLYRLLVDGLKKWGTPAQEYLLEMTNRVEGKTLASVIGLLTRLLKVDQGNKQAERFAAFLETEDMAVATAAASAVARFGNAEVIEGLLSLINSPYERVRRSAGHALREVGARYPEEVRQAIGEVEISGLRGIELCKTIEVVGTEEDTELLAVMLASPTPKMRAAAIKALAGINGPGAVDTIALAMTDEDLRVQMAAAASLGRIGPAASETIVSALAMAKGPLKAALIRTLGEVGHPEAQDILRSMCLETADVALAALEAIHTLGLDAEEIQDDILGHPDSEVVKQALCVFGTNITSESLAKLLGHSQWDVRLAAVERLASMSAKKVEALLTEHMEKETDYLVNKAIEQVLKRR